jgi:amidase
LGKTNLSEWANYRSTTSTSGWSGRGGQTRNPYVLDRSPIGSSSGSAVAVAANLCVVAVGTETSGSIMSPSSANGIVGIKPTVGLVSRSGIVPIAASQDTAGPMARSVRDAALVLAVLADKDDRDRATAQQPADLAREFAPAPNAHALRGARIGVLHGPFRFHARMEAVLNAQLDALRAAGATVVDLGELTALGDISKSSGDVLSYEFKDGINAYLADLGPNSPMKTLADLIRFNDDHRAEEMPFMGQELFVRAQAKGPLTDEAYQVARAACIRVSRTEGIDGLSDKNHLDAIVALTAGPAWVVDPVGGDSGSGGSSSLPAMAGYPNVTVPAAQVFGLPVGLSFFGRAWTEPKLIALAADFEAHTHARREPKFLPTAPVTGGAGGGAGAGAVTDSPAAPAR